MVASNNAYRIRESLKLSAEVLLAEAEFLRRMAAELRSVEVDSAELDSVAGKMQALADAITDA